MAEEPNKTAHHAEKDENTKQNAHTEGTDASGRKSAGADAEETRKGEASTEDTSGGGQAGKQSGKRKETKSSESGDKKKQAKKQKKKKDKQTQLQEEIEDLKQQVSTLKEKNLREQAELDNFRRRAQKDQANAKENGKGSVLQEFFPVYDHFRMAMEHTQQNPDFETLKQGMDMIFTEFGKAFENLGVKEINAEGEVFDPNQHEAVAQEPSEEIPEGKVARQWKCGYMLGDRLLRPATVVVSSGPTQSSGESESGQDSSEDSNNSETNNQNEGSEED